MTTVSENGRDVTMAQNTFHDFLADRIDVIAKVHLNRSTSLHAVISDSVDAYTSAFAEYHGTDVPLDLLAPEVRSELSDFIHRCAEAVEEPENPQFPVRR
ncbi:hypothetical protein CH306_05820 [Rhodococcus sp. 15-725-2-2b]|jgi:hypothetical protein|uniref:hypothetical protein n=1 Tax=unclassified Rhodococcus (in: high G+C Gram-positive bacteria) TaxID=192944 RepID=UPI000B9B990F|nr:MULTISPECIES: hypothetical protein [unclassified Rhodococcus (in: high G+C Gram-positive bacteria)]OZC70058.1 hypothetical protein CH277_07940 [Rhodococcus sp. 06-469-3-2]OZC81323.1 hypothetical protein CH274_10875 [Rhodococcus sp. 06-418-5]OZD40419.1 hypothetical protein CH264_26755 [Rhodococcus sp. 06-1477-1A]OZE75226.1 hypothetical protein CH306_05820 [Rhodococcus sp. 15-725-2-2b]OZF36026.1 hypothetical protein CH296_06885 [Rhodococcus sp. 14-2496-1d]